jgi:hypothetical protein
MTRRLTPDERVHLIAIIHDASNNVLQAVLDALGITDPDLGLQVPDVVLDAMITELEEAP